MPRIKVAQIIEATLGGTRRHLNNLVFHLNRGRFEVHVLCATFRDPRFRGDVERMRAAGLTVHVIPMVRDISPAADLRALGQLWKRLRCERYDIVHTHSAKGGFLGRLAAFLTHAPVVLYTPNAFPFMRRPTGWRARSYALLERLAAHWTTKIIAVSEGEREAGLAAKVGRPEQYVVIENAIDLEAMRTNTQPADLRAELGLRADDFVIGTVGRLTAQKGQTYLLAAFPEVVAAVPTAHLVLVGRGELRADLEAQAQALGLAGRVVFAGEREDVTAFYDAFDLFVLPSLWEGCPYVLLEAMSRGKATVATRVPGAGDILQKTETGLLVPPGDAPALAAALIELARDASRRQRLGERARALVEERYRIQRLIGEVETLYEGLLGKKTPP